MLKFLETQKLVISLRLNNSKIEAHAIVDSSKVVNSCIEEGSVVGPMSYVSNNKTIK